MDCSYSRSDIYDLEYKNYDRDLRFYQYMAATFSGSEQARILELSCGTGRICIPLATQGFRVTGVDISYPMVLKAKEKWERCKVNGNGSLRLVVGDMIKPPVWGSGYNFAFIPFNGFMHLLTREDQHECLESVRRSLKDKGFFLAEIGIPDFTQGYKTHEIFKIFERENILLCRKMVLDADPCTQIVRRIFFYRIFELTGERKEIESFWEPRDYSYLFPLQWEELLVNSGFNIIKKYGDFDYNNFDSGSRIMLWLCQKA